MHCERKVKSFDNETVGTDEYPIILASWLSVLAHDWCRIELSLKVDAIWIWYHLGVCLYEQRKATNKLGRGWCALSEIPLGAPCEYVDSVTATLTVVLSPTALIHPIPLNMTLLTVIVAGALSHTRLHPSEMRARLPLEVQFTLFHRCIWKCQSVSSKHSQPYEFIRIYRHLRDLVSRKTNNFWSKMILQFFKVKWNAIYFLSFLELIPRIMVWEMVACDGDYLFLQKPQVSRSCAHWQHY